ncbi:cytokine receptor-like factor 2 isoform X1 [Carassius gibelio]|uniref:cytokine receptor-like factor 2 isoform X1 n=1 Tax=Carassius gibelio TaxID=101364 RepID=UPI002278CD34|nr:cytokine receptor-like factor 2 isoform X1 [Carassius gibelio]
MNSWSVYHLLVLALLFASLSSAEYDDELDDDEYDVILDIDPDQIHFTISNTSHGLNIKWKIPDENDNPDCYEAEVQYKSQCVKDWEDINSIKVTQTHLNLNYISMKKNYDFRIRMRKECLNKPWSNWTKVQSWGNNADACVVEASAYIWVYILIIVLPLTAFLLVCLLTQQGIRRLILPEVPDPKHFKNKIMDAEQFQWWENFTHWNEECSTTDVEIMDKNEIEEQHQTLVIQPMDTNPEQHDSMYCIYSSQTSGENTEPQYSQSVLGYIIL